MGSTTTPLGASLLLSLLLLGACSSEPALPAGAECRTDTECKGTGAVCLSNKCFEFVASCDECSEKKCTDRCLAGVPGPKGPEGATGAAGPTGPEGGTGAVGPQGDLGPAGPVGPTGVAGPVGLDGPVGPAGAVGPMGAQGPMGPQGPIGPTGVAGPAGATGVAGPIGPTGVAGPAGPTGVAGPIGPTGVAGPAGATGVAGPIGPTGVAGPAGATGVAGPAGPTGATGLAGVGATGPQGAPGQPGPAGNLYGEEAPSFVGFTIATTQGNIGSREQMHAICAAQYAGSHFCHVGEYESATPATPVPASGAWADASAFSGTSTYYPTTGVSGPNVGRYTASDSSYNCVQWTVNNTYSGTVILPTGPTNGYCNVARPLACCNTPYRETFKGFSSLTTQGNIGSREQMHGVCAAQFSGSHMCTSGEYYRTGNATPVPAPGAWVDAASFSGGSTYYPTVGIASHNLGRYTASDSSYNCVQWTVNNTYSGSVLLSTGPTNGYCNVARPVACCQ
jgi:hypothetical protein